MSSIVPVPYSNVPRPLSDDERANLLSEHLSRYAAGGYRIEPTGSRFSAMLVSGKPVNHVLHAILTLLLCGIWGIVWIVVALSGGVQRQFVEVDPYGRLMMGPARKG